MSGETQLCTFTIGPLLCGVPVTGVQEVLRECELTSVPLTTRIVRGLLNLRGEVVIAIDLRTRLGLPNREGDTGAAHVIIRSDDEQVSLVVDTVEDVVTMPASSLEPPPQTLVEPARTYITGVYQLEGRLLLVLDAKAVVAPEVFE